MGGPKRLKCSMRWLQGAALPETLGILNVPARIRPTDWEQFPILLTSSLHSTAPGWRSIIAIRLKTNDIVANPGWQSNCVPTFREPRSGLSRFRLNPSASRSIDFKDLEIHL